MGSGGFAARILDQVVHPLPGKLIPGPGSFNVLIGNLPAWRGLPLALSAGLQAAKTTSDAAIKTAEAAATAAMGTPAAPAAKAAEQLAKAGAAAAMGSLISSTSAGADIHMCVTLLPAPPHGPGVVIDGSPTVFINSLPACRLGDTIIEAVGPPNKIIMGKTTVYIGNRGSTGGGSAPPKVGKPSNAAPVKAFKEASVSGSASAGPANGKTGAAANNNSAGEGSAPQTGNPVSAAPVMAFKEASQSGSALVGPCKTCGKI